MRKLSRISIQFNGFNQKVIRKYSVLETEKAHRLPCGTKITALHNGKTYFPALLDAISNSKKEVLVEKYWISNDIPDANFKDYLLKAKTLRDIDVRIIYDSFGSSHSSLLFKELQASGILTQEYNPISCDSIFKENTLLSGVLLRRDHRKMIVVDREVAFIGGINLGKEWACQKHGGSGWRDVMIKVEGPICHVFADIFGRMSSLLNDFPHDFLISRKISEIIQRKKYFTSRPLISERRLTPHKSLHSSDLSMNIWRSQDKQKRLRKFRKKSYVQKVESCLQILTNDSWSGRKSILRAYEAGIMSAKKSITICNGYFIPDARLVGLLLKAVKRGVEVTVLVPEKPDVFMYKWFSLKVCKLLLRQGVKVYEYKPSVLHSKVATFDDEVSIVGSFNLDPVSHSNNLEIISVVHNKGFTQELSASLNYDIQVNSQELKAEEKESFTDRIVGLFQSVFQGFIILK